MTELERALALARAELSPSSADKARSRAALGLPQPSFGALGVAERRRELSSWAALRASGRAGMVVGGALLGAGIAIGFWLRGSSDVREAPVSLAPVSSPVLQATAGEPTAPARPARLGSTSSLEPERPDASAEASRVAMTSAADERSHVASAATGAPRRPRARASGASMAAERGVTSKPYDEELVLLQRVERALRANNPAFALALIGELDERFPGTRLAEERLAASVIAHCQLGSPGSRSRVTRFLAERPASVYSDRIKVACAAFRDAEPPALKNVESTDTHLR